MILLPFVTLLSLIKESNLQCNYKQLVHKKYGKQTASNLPPFENTKQPL